MAYSYPADADFLAVKRIVAGGGGRVEIRDGDVLVDGKIQRKTLAQLRELCILVHDDHFRPSRDATLPARWQGASSNSPWHCTESGYEFTAGTAPAESEVEWLEYTQWICWPNASPPAARTTPTLIFDHDGYNQSLTRGALHHVTDVLLQCGVKLSGTGRLLLQINAGADSFQLELTCPQEDCRLIHNGETVWQLHDLVRAASLSATMECGDGRLRSAGAGFDQRHSFAHVRVSADSFPAELPALVPLAIGAAGRPRAVGCTSRLSRSLLPRARRPTMLGAARTLGTDTSGSCWETTFRYPSTAGATVPSIATRSSDRFASCPGDATRTRWPTRQLLVIPFTVGKAQ